MTNCGNRKEKDAFYNKAKSLTLKQAVNMIGFCALKINPICFWNEGDVIFFLENRLVGTNQEAVEFCFTDPPPRPKASSMVSQNARWEWLKFG